MSKMQTWIILAMIAAVGILLPFFNKKNAVPAKYTYPIMGTVCTVTFFETRETAENAAKAVYEQLRKIEKMCNIFDAESEIAKLNKSAASKPFVCSEELFAILKHCRDSWQMTDGAFDITARVLMDLWGFYQKRNTVPSAAEIKNAMAKTGMDKVIFNDAEKSVFFSVNGLSFDLGGVAKGAALDAAVKAAFAAGAENFIINLGGNIACFGKNQNGNDFYEIGIRDPQKRDAVIKKIRISNSFCATSGSYERFSVLNGKKYSHIMDPATGGPVQNAVSSTVVTAKGIDSDIFSTACFILGENHAKKFADSGKIREFFLVSSNENNSMKYSYYHNHTTREVKK